MGFDFPRDWRILAVEECVEALIDYRGKSPEKTTFGIPLITAKVVKNGSIARFTSDGAIPSPSSVTTNASSAKSA